MTWGRFSVEQMPAVDRHVPAGPADLFGFEENKRIISDPATVSTGVFEPGIQAERFANVLRQFDESLGGDPQP